MTWVWVVVIAGVVIAGGWFFFSKKKNPMEEYKGKVVAEWVLRSGFKEISLIPDKGQLIEAPTGIEKAEGAAGKYIFDERGLYTVLWPPLSKNQIAIKGITWDEGIAGPRLRPDIDENTTLTEQLKFASNMEYMNWAAKFGKNFAAMANALMHPKWPIWAYLVIIVGIIVSAVGTYYAYKIWGVIGG